MRRSGIILGIAILISLGINSCNNQDTPPIPTLPQGGKPDLSINFFHLFDGAPFSLNKFYLTQNQDSIQISEHKYIVSNVVLRNTNSNKGLVLQDSYFLVKVPLEGNHFELNIDGIQHGLDTGEWNEIELMIGLDSATNFEPEGGPKLFADEGMFWEWNTGYKFFVVEGRYYSKNLSFPSVGTIAHIGELSNQAILKFDLGQVGGLKLVNGKTSAINLNVNVDQLYYNPNLINLANSDYRQAMGGNPAREFRENYSTDYWKLAGILNP